MTFGVVERARHFILLARHPCRGTLVLRAVTILIHHQQRRIHHTIRQRLLA